MKEDLKCKNGVMWVVSHLTPPYQYHRSIEHIRLPIHLSLKLCPYLTLFLRWTQ